MNLWPFRRRDDVLTDAEAAERWRANAWEALEMAKKWRDRCREMQPTDAARTLSAVAAAQRAQQCVSERQAVRAKALEIARGIGRADLVARF